MMSMTFLWIAVAFGGGGANDLLDYLPTKAYWKAKGVDPTLKNMMAELARPAQPDAKKLPALFKQLGSDEFAVRESATAGIRAMGPAVLPEIKAEAQRATDAEVRARLAQLVTELSRGGKSREVRLLMAIRTLGEMKKREALESLRSLAESKKPFVAEYAKAAIAAVEGKKYSRPQTAAKDLAGDPWLMPNYVGVVGQMAVPGGAKASLEESLKKMAEMAGPGAPPGSADQMQEMMAKAMIPVAEQVGNLRLGAVTFAVSEDIGNQTGFGIAVARGIYDPEAIKAMVVGMGGKCESVNGVDVLRINERRPALRLLMPSSRRIVLVIGANEESIAQPVKDMLAALKKGKGTLADNQKMAALVKAIKPADRPWVAACISKSYALAPLLAGFETVMLTGKREGKATQLTVIGRGKDDEKIKAAAEIMKGFRDQASEGLKRQAERAPLMKPLADLAAGVKFVAEPGKLSISGRLEGDASPLMLMGLPWLMVARSSAKVEAVRAEAVQVEKVEAR